MNSLFAAATTPVLTEEDLASDAYCCFGSVDHGPEGCTCWVPIFDLEQVSPDRSTRPRSRTKCCHDCAYRQGSPEREDPDSVDLQDLAGGDGIFWCHQGQRRAIAYRHPDGRERPAHPGDYQPPIVDAVPYLASGAAGERCAGWDVIRRALLGPAASLSEDGAAAGFQQQPPLVGVGGERASRDTAADGLGHSPHSGESSAEGRGQAEDLAVPSNGRPANATHGGASPDQPLVGAGAGNREGTASTAAASRLAPSTGRAKSPAARSSSGADSDENTTDAIAGTGAEDMEGVGVAPAPTGLSADSGERPDQHQRRSDQ